MNKSLEPVQFDHGVLERYLPSCPKSGQSHPKKSARLLMSSESESSPDASRILSSEPESERLEAAIGRAKHIFFFFRKIFLVVVQLLARPSKFACRYGSNFGGYGCYKTIEGRIVRCEERLQP